MDSLRTRSAGGWFLRIGALSVLAWLAPAATAQTHSVYGYDFVTIGDAGNRATNDDELTFLTQGARYGAVNYEYRMATTEVTIGQYFEFVQAYAPLYTQRTGSAFLGHAFTGPGISGSQSNAAIREGYSQNRAAQMGWEYAARYANWLHNGKVNEAWAFDNGAYDTGTFTQNPDGSYNHQETHNPDAKFWIPSLDEWVKAAHWDPAKNGGEGGYWAYSTSSNVEPIAGLLTANGGERNAGPEPLFPLDVGSFSDVRSPWGLLDVAGGESEMLETPFGSSELRALAGSGYFDWSYGSIVSKDLLGEIGASFVVGSGFGLRLASAVPSPGAAFPLVLFITFRKLKRKNDQ